MSGELIDTNVYVSRWPFRRIYGDEPGELVELLRSHGVTSAWTGSIDGIFHRDVAGVNARLAQTCRTHGDGLLTPFGAVNPMWPEWEDDVRRCAEEHDMRGIRLHPNYHGYRLNDPLFERIVALATERRLLVQLVVSMEDQRVMHPLMRVSQVDLTPLPDVLAHVANARILLLNAVGALPGGLRQRLLATERVYFDSAGIEGAEGIARFLESAQDSALVFGSYTPLFYHEAAHLKLRESVLTAEQNSAIRYGNALRLLDPEETRPAQ